MERLVDTELSGRQINRVRHIILASPDIDVDLFQTQLGLLSPEVRDKLYILVSEDDDALKVSRRIAGGVPRLGAQSADALDGLGVKVIDLTQVDVLSSSSHAKFADSPEIVKLIGDGLNRTGSLSRERQSTLQAIVDTIPIRIVR